MSPAGSGRPELDLRSYLNVLRRRWLVIVAGAIIGALVAGAVSLVLTKNYTAETDVLVQPEADIFATASSSSQANTQIADRFVTDQVSLIQSPRVYAVVVQQYGPNAPAVTATSTTGSDVIALTVSGTNKVLVARIANAYAQAYRTVRVADLTVDDTAATAQLSRQIDDLQKQITAINNQIAAAPPDQRDALVQSLRPQQTTLQTQQGALAQRKDQIGINAQLAGASSKVITPASVPTSSSGLATPLLIAIGLAAGLLLGLALIFVLELVDDTIHSERELERMDLGTEWLGSIPVGPRSAKDSVVVVTEPNAAAADAFHLLRGSLMSRLPDARGVIVVTSPSRDEGKTTVAANLAAVFAETGARVVLVGADLRRPRIHQLFSMPDQPGLSSVLNGDAMLSEALRPSVVAPELTVLPSGPVPPGPAELLSMPVLGDLVDQLQAQFQIVIVDAPSLLPVADAAILARLATVVVVVAAIGRTSAGAVRETLRRVEQTSDATAIGVVNLSRSTRPKHYRPRPGQTSRRRTAERQAPVPPAPNQPVGAPSEVS